MLLIRFFKRLWQSERNPFAWRHLGSTFGNTSLHLHGEYYIHKYTGRQLFVPKYKRRQQ